ncbi:MAG TPA: hypothetical protein PLN06_04205 [Bacteroidales bacterium]|nr:hypothetical protein [Bacteroidales bacterium]HCI55345.1 hypothetical protein [Bacteroidales bacterium]HOU95810.1 hypothetical protein [Bacteroidales bacterium]HQG36918.1 hypothetical protein [Bacteroidales bacterium]HQG52583.1 hypothetical protein [Bacteroidales bacterium]
MKLLIDIPEPILFNPLKHHIGFIREFIEQYSISSGFDKSEFFRILGHIGGSVMDVYTGILTCEDILKEAYNLLDDSNLLIKENFLKWAGIKSKEFRIIQLSDSSNWVVKYYNHERHWAHIFPARLSPHSFRIKANTLKSAILYQVLIGKDFVTEEGLNAARVAGGLSPIKDVFDAEAITEMIDILRS